MISVRFFICNVFFFLSSFYLGVFSMAPWSLERSQGWAAQEGVEGELIILFLTMAKITYDCKLVLPLWREKVKNHWNSTGNKFCCFKTYKFIHVRILTICWYKKGHISEHTDNILKALHVPGSNVYVKNNGRCLGSTLATKTWQSSRISSFSEILLCFYFITFLKWIQGMPLLQEE